MAKVIECTNSDCYYNEKQMCKRETIRLLFFLGQDRIICDGEILRETSTDKLCPTGEKKGEE